MPQIAGMIENGHPHLLALNVARVINPACLFSPDRFAACSFAVDRLAQFFSPLHRRMFFEPQIRVRADSHHALFGVTQFHLAMRGPQGGGDINRPATIKGRKRQPRRVAANRLAVGTDPQVISHNHGVAGFVFFDFYALVFDVADLVPEVPAVHIVETEPDALMVGMVFGLALHPIDHRPTAGHGHPARAQYGKQDRFFMRAVVVGCKGLATEHHLHLAIAGLGLDGALGRCTRIVCSQRKCEQEHPNGPHGFPSLWWYLAVTIVAELKWCRQSGESRKKNYPSRLSRLYNASRQ